MSEFDRLTTLMERFSLQVRVAPVEAATLVVTADAAGIARHVWFDADRLDPAWAGQTVLFSAAVDWGGDANPLIAVLPEAIDFDLSGDPQTASLVALIQSELEASRCGSASVVNRLGEVLIVRLLRAQIETGSTKPGLLAGLSDPRLSRALVTIHAQPGRQWRNEDLAAIAGLSLSRFAEMFVATVGETPSAYLRRWRLTLARQDLQRGDRVDAIARRYGYRSPEGFGRAFRQHFGKNPLAMRGGAARSSAEGVRTR
ncbi:AraC family transcriptional regulator [Hoeflea sp. G2-23]|uniref:AraC family transcriptional regulator n=1 Tax=Hoeflea algicola TaxID=2983763 RepID=A0ABT3Z8N7_9HYPH|nr:AraC family transcriptional regulator [Hoeflea algicola]MCY0148112.1 AraC family transcriptional regulator [Hoeflea algicola]